MSEFTASPIDPDLRRMIPHEGPGTTVQLFSGLNLRGILDLLEAMREGRQLATSGNPGLLVSPSGQALLVEAVTRLIGQAATSPRAAYAERMLRGPDCTLTVEKVADNLVGLRSGRDGHEAVELLSCDEAKKLGQMLLNVGKRCGVQAPPSSKAPLLKAVDADADMADLAERAGRYLRHWMELVPATATIKGPNPLPELLVAMASRLLPRSSRGGSIEDDELAGLLEVLGKRRDDAMRDYLGSTGEEVRERYWGEAQAFRAAIDLVSDIPRHRPHSAAVAAEVTT